MNVMENNNLPSWAIRLALRAAQLVQDVPPATAVSLTLVRQADGEIVVITPRTEILQRPKLDTNGRSD